MDALVREVYNLIALVTAQSPTEDNANAESQSLMECRNDLASQATMFFSRCGKLHHSMSWAWRPKCLAVSAISHTVTYIASWRTTASCLARSVIPACPWL